MRAMSTLGLALAATLSFSSPETDAPIIVVTPSPQPPPPTETAAPRVIVVPPPAPSPVPPPPPIPPAPVTPRKPMTGIGLMAAGASAFLIGVGAQLTNFADQAAYCRSWDARGFNGVHGCFYHTEPWGVHMGTGFAFGSALVMTSIGAGALGQYHAWDAAFGGARERNGRSRVVAGAVFVSLGIGAAIAEGFLLRRELNDFCTTHECEVQRRALYYGLADASAASFIAGMAMMSYGSNYKNNRRRYGQHWTLAPQAGPGMLGAGGSLRF